MVINDKLHHVTWTVRCRRRELQLSQGEPKSRRRRYVTNDVHLSCIDDTQYWVEFCKILLEVVCGGMSFLVLYSQNCRNTVLMSL